MYTHMYKFKPFHILFYLEQLAAVVIGNKNVGACTYTKDRRLPSESMYVPVYVCVFFFSL